MRPLLLSTCDTVIGETPARFETSWMVTGLPLGLGVDEGRKTPFPSWGTVRLETRNKRNLMFKGCPVGLMYRYTKPAPNPQSVKT